MNKLAELLDDLVESWTVADLFLVLVLLASVANLNCRIDQLFTEVSSTQDQIRNLPSGNR